MRLSCPCIRLSHIREKIIKIFWKFHFIGPTLGNLPNCDPWYTIIYQLNSSPVELTHLHFTELYSTLSTLLNSTLLSSTQLNSSLLYSTLLCFTYSTLLYSTLLYSTHLFCRGQYYYIKFYYICMRKKSYNFV